MCSPGAQKVCEGVWGVEVSVGQLTSSGAVHFPLSLEDPHPTPQIHAPSLSGEDEIPDVGVKGPHSGSLHFLAQVKDRVPVG